MCGRYKLSAKNESVWEHFDIHGDDISFAFLPRYNIAPTQAVLVFREPQEPELIRWGIKLPNPKAGGFNVRVESLGAPFYRDSIRGRRCLIVADGFYEWKSLVEAKKPYLIKRHDGQPFAFAGLWDKVQVKGEMVDACAILTTTPRGVMPEVHDRMPVILPASAQAAWLDPKSRYADLLEPDADALELVEVSTLVNSVKNDDARLAMPVVS
ncbi:MAG: SOS response-associated peptidase [Polyangiaceae bacterium]